MNSFLLSWKKSLDGLINIPHISWFNCSLTPPTVPVCGISPHCRLPLDSRASAGSFLKAVLTTSMLIFVGIVCNGRHHRNCFYHYYKYRWSLLLKWVSHQTFVTLNFAIIVISLCINTVIINYVILTIKMSILTSVTSWRQQSMRMSLQRSKWQCHFNICFISVCTFVYKYVLVLTIFNEVAYLKLKSIFHKTLNLF